MSAGIKSNQQRQFGLLLTAVGAVLAWSVWRQGYGLWTGIPASGATATLLLAFARPAVFAVPLNGWMRLADVLGRLFNPIVLGLVYALLVVPIGLLYRLKPHPSLARRFRDPDASYWVERDKTRTTAEDFNHLF